MIKVAFVRGKYLNNFEGQNYAFDQHKIKLIGFSSMNALHRDFSFPVMRLASISDFLGDVKAVKAIANRAWGDSQVLFGLSKFASQFDIFHTADPHYYYSYQLAKLRSQNKIKKLLVTSWETIPHNNETVSTKKKIKQFVLRHADKFLCYTEKAKQCLIKEGVDGNKIEVIRLGVNLDTFPKKRTISAEENKGINILLVGRLVEEKGIIDLYNAVKNIKKQSLKIKSLSLTIVGDGPLKHRLEKMIKKDSLTQCVHIIQTTYESIPKVFREADIFVLPSKRNKTWEEQYGMVLIEAMATGLPIVAYDTGAIREVLSEAGSLVKEGDITGLENEIKSLIESPSLRQKIGTMGRRRAEKEFDSRKTAKKIEQLYKKLYVSAK